MFFGISTSILIKVATQLLPRLKQSKNPLHPCILMELMPSFHSFVAIPAEEQRFSYCFLF
jgi:hypothetical protein